MHGKVAISAASLLPDLSGDLSATNKALGAICESCVMVSTDLITHLHNLKVPEGQRHRRWSSFRKALKSVWSKDDLEKTMRRLDR